MNFNSEDLGICWSKFRDFWIGKKPGPGCQDPGINSLVATWNEHEPK